MKRIMVMAGILFLGAICVSSSSNAAGFKEGQWDMSMTIQMGGGMADEMAKAQKEMDKMAPEEKAMMQQMMGNMGVKMGAANSGGMTISRKQCLTNANPVPKKEEEENCQETHTSSGNTVKFEVICKDSHSTGEITYNNDSMKGSIQSTQKHGGKEEKVVMDIKGQYTGPCGG